MKTITLNKEEVDFLEKYVEGKYNAFIAPIHDQNIEMQLLEKAGQYEDENNLVDERLAFSDDCDILKWFYHRYLNQ